MGSKLKLVKPKHRAKVIKFSGDIQECIKSNYQDVEDKMQLKYLCSFIEYVCCLVEESYSKPSIENKKVNKKDEVLKHMSKFLNITLSEQDICIISDIIEDLHSSHRIKKVSYLAKTFFTLMKVFLKKDS